MWCPFCDHWFDGRDHLGGHVASVHREAWDFDPASRTFDCVCGEAFPADRNEHEPGSIVAHWADVAVKGDDGMHAMLLKLRT